MKCILGRTDDPPEDGKEKFVCRRGCRTAKGPKTLWVPVGNVIHDPGPCTAWPMLSEPDEWRKLFLESTIDLVGEMTGLTWAVRVAEYNRWKAAGCKLDDIPKWLPSPNMALLPPPPNGPGTELKKLLQALDIAPTEACWCEALAAEMNRWGVEGCRLRRKFILAHLESEYNDATIATKVKALAHAVAKGMPKTLAGLLDEALRRAAANTPSPDRL